MITFLFNGGGNNLRMNKIVWEDNAEANVWERLQHSS